MIHAIHVYINPYMYTFCVYIHTFFQVALARDSLMTAPTLQLLPNWVFTFKCPQLAAMRSLTAAAALWRRRPPPHRRSEAVEYRQGADTADAAAFSAANDASGPENPSGCGGPHGDGGGGSGGAKGRPEGLKMKTKGLLN